MVNWNRGDWQGRDRRQVENNYKVVGYSVIIGVILLALAKELYYFTSIVYVSNVSSKLF